MNPKVSICIPAFKQPELLRRTLQSVIIQSFDDYEIIITDDSPDVSVENIVKEFLPENKIRYYRNPTIKGSPENWNEAVRHASGEYIKILHHDDWFSGRDSLAEFVKMLDDNPAANLAFCSSIIHSHGKKTRKHSPTPRQLKKLKKNPYSLFHGNIIGAPSATIYRNILNMKYNEKLTWLVDVDYYIRYLKEDTNFTFKSKPLICTTDGASHQVSGDCINNKKLQLFEYGYLFKNIPRKYRFNLANIIFLLKLIRKFKVRKTEEFVAAEVETPIPIIIKYLLFISNIVPLFAFKSWNKSTASIGFIVNLLRFRHMNRFAQQRFSFLWKDLYPRLNDVSTSTDYDRHYIYHPAWAARILSQNKPVCHVDISSTLNFCTVVSAFVPVKFYDYRPADLKLSNLSSEAADLTDLPFADCSIQSLSCMHVVEHIGLGRYGDMLDPDGDLKAISELKRVLAEGGSLLFVVPIGKPKIMFNAHRIYSYDQIVNYFSELELQEFALIPENSADGGLLRNASGKMADAEAYGCGCFWFKKRVR